MFSFRVVEHFDVVEHILPCFCAGFIEPSAYPLPFEQVEEALGNGIVIGLACLGGPT